MKRILLIILALFSFLSLPLQAQFSGGSGTDWDPYQIRTPQELDNLRNYLGPTYGGANFKLMEDINLSSWGDWTPIGNTDEIAPCLPE